MDSTLHDALADISARVARGCSDADLIDVIADLEHLQRAAVAVQAEAIAALSAQVRARDAERGVARERRGASVAPQVALARGASPRKGDRYVGTANALVHEMPHTLAALRSGRVDEWTVTGIVRETSCLSTKDRGRLDAGLVKEFSRHGVAGARIVNSARALAQELDPAAAVARIARAERERCVSVRPAPEGMSWVTALLPMRDGVAVNAALLRAAQQQHGGDDRTRAQVMADVFVERLTGRNPLTEPVAVTVNLVMTEEALLRGGEQSASVLGIGPLPARHARVLVQDAAQRDRAWVRRLYTASDQKSLVGMDAKQRLFPSGLAAFLRLRDQRCATPFCDAPIQHADHVTPHRSGGETSAGNGQGLCARCNYTKEIPGFTAARDPDTGTTTLTTPTGHRYARDPSDVLGHATLPGHGGEWHVVHLRWKPGERLRAA